MTGKRERPTVEIARFWTIEEFADACVALAAWDAAHNPEALRALIVRVPCDVLTKYLEGELKCDTVKGR